MLVILLNSNEKGLLTQHHNVGKKVNSVTTFVPHPSRMGKFGWGRCNVNLIIHDQGPGMTKNFKRSSKASGWLLCDQSTGNDRFARISTDVD